MTFYSSSNFNVLMEILVVGGMVVSWKLYSFNTKIPQWSSPPKLTAYFHIANWVLLGYYVASSGNLLPTFRDNISVSSSRIKNSKNSRVNTTFLILVSYCSPSTWNSQLHSSATYSKSPFHNSFLLRSISLYFCPTYLTRKTSGQCLGTSRFLKSPVSFPIINAVHL